MDCHRATYLIEKRAEQPLSFSERMQLFIHLLGCGVCRIYRRQSKVIAAGLKAFFSGRHAERTLDDGLKKRMQDEINERLRQ